MIIDNCKAEMFLRNVIQRNVVIQQAENNEMAMDTLFVESFYKVFNLFNDGKILFGNEEYLRRSKPGSKK